MFAPQLTILTLLASAVLSVDYDPEASRRMRSYSLIGHCSQQQIEQWNCKLCSQTEQLKDLVYVEDKRTQIMAFGGYMSSIDKIVFMFRGTIDDTNWIEDFSYYQVKYGRCGQCKIHEGFYLSYLSVALEIKEAAKTLRSKYPGKDIVMTGASLGGALATVAAVELKTQGVPISQLHTYGSPRVGNLQLSSFIKESIPKSLRVVHYRDIVPHLPLQSQNYHHVPSEVLFDEAMQEYRICDASGEDPDCSNSYSPNYNPEDHVTYWIRLNVTEICSRP